jgi:hypothetical protein
MKVPRFASIDGREATFKTTDGDVFYIRSGGTAASSLTVGDSACRTRYIAPPTARSSIWWGFHPISESLSLPMPTCPLEKIRRWPGR